MEQTVRIVTDSGGDLPLQLRQEYDIESVPLTVHFGAEVYRDGELTVDEFWEKAAGPHHPQTSQPPVGAYEEVFERLVALGKQVLCVTITGKHSGTFNAAHLAAQRFGEAVTVFDSLSLSLGEGVQALVAAEAARAGRSMAEILALLERPANPDAAADRAGHTGEPAARRTGSRIHRRRRPDGASAQHQGHDQP